MKKENKCEHHFRIFNDPNLKNTGYLSFFCDKCLLIRKVKKDYEATADNKG